ncbi:hypothetical protein CHS0354_039372 [Potamilus streckersoni]|uniref:Uncharacterized protein n=1 Tax=Potamilus streckersoni TaxID=2493646 RepID=A0AAE0W6J7_9BIVA|nr:hypothetical protein CHS0354_039372 [Potamilus streckersoni]
MVEKSYKQCQSEPKSTIRKSEETIWPQQNTIEKLKKKTEEEKKAKAKEKKLQKEKERKQIQLVEKKTPFYVLEEPKFGEHITDWNTGNCLDRRDNYTRGKEYNSDQQRGRKQKQKWKSPIQQSPRKGKIHQHRELALKGK